MRLRTRLALAFTGVTAVALVASFSVTYVLVQRDELREIDHALLVQADRLAVNALDTNRGDPRIPDGEGELLHPPVLTLRYAAVYEHEGRIMSSSRSFGGHPPPLDRLGAPPGADAGTAVDFVYEDIHLRGVLVPIGSRTLLYAVSRAGIDADLAFLLRLFLGIVAAATLLTWGVAQVLSRSLLRDLDAINEVTAAVAGGALDSRVGGRATGSTETRLLAERLDAMIGRLAELVASQKVFISSAAHELRSPLTSLRGELELALRRERTAEEYRDTIERALDDSVTLTTLADDLLALARLEGRARVATERPDDINLREVVDDALRMSRGNAEARSVQVSIDDSVDGVVVRCSRKDAARALRNLLDNAIKHSPTGGAVTMRATSAEDHVDLAVEDLGAGVASTDAAVLFAPFWRGAGEPQGEGGAGLGLALAREIARAEGGDVIFDESYTEGARFVLRLRPSSAKVSSRRQLVSAG